MGFQPAVICMAAMRRRADFYFRDRSGHGCIMWQLLVNDQCHVVGLRPTLCHARAMELRQLRYFLAVAETGNITRAAAKIFLTQSALSRQIKALEDEIGHALLERQAHSIRLTPLGEVLVDEAGALLDQADALLERLRGGDAGDTLRVGYAPSLGEGILSEAVEVFSQMHPKMRIELLDLSTQEMLAGMESDKLDVVLTVGFGRDVRGVEWTPLVRAPWKLAVPRSHPLAKVRTVRPDQLADIPVLGFCRRDYPEYWEIISPWFSQNRLRPKIAGEYDGVDSLLAAVGSGLGVAMVVNRPTHMLPDRVRLKPVVQAPGDVSIVAGTSTHRAGVPAVQVFLNELTKAAPVLR